MPIKNLPANPDLDHLKLQAKTLLKAVKSGDPGAIQRIREFHPHFRDLVPVEISLSDAQLAIAREYAFASWPKLRAFVEKELRPDQRPLVERIKDSNFRHAVELLDAGDERGLRTFLRAHPSLVRQKVFFSVNDYFGQPTLLEFVAENPHRNGKLPSNAVEIAKITLTAGADRRSASRTLELVSSGNLARQQGLQVPLIDLLCSFHADPDMAMPAALVHGEFEAVSALLAHGARVDLPVAAALGRAEEARSLLINSTPDERQRALAYASQFGRVDITAMLLEVGEDPNRFNPIGCHSHSTPLHQAALAGHLEVVKLLLEHGASLDTKDLMFGGTPLGWAEHGKQQAVADYLRSLGAPPRL